MIIFKKVTFRNFFSFGQRDIELDLQKYDTTLVSGNSGSGKSTMIVEALTFALFNKPFRKIKKNDIINVINGKDCFITVEFTIGSIEYQIIRGLKPDIFEIYQNGVLVNQNPSVRDYQKFLEENILQMSYRTWCQIVVLGYANHTPFMLLSAHERRQMVDEVLGIEIFQKMFIRTREIVSNLRQSISEKEIEIEGLKSSIEIQKKSLRQVQLQEKEKEAELLLEIDELSKKIDEITEKNSYIDGLISSLKDSISKKDIHERKKNELSKIQTKLAHNKIQKENFISFLENNSTCPTCLQQIREEHKSLVKNESEEKIKEFDSALIELETRISSFDELLLEANSVLSEIIKLNQEQAINQKTIQHLQTSIIEKHAYISKLQQNDNSVIRTLAKTIVELAEKQKDLQKIREEETSQLRHYIFCQGLLKEDGIKGKIISMYLPLLTSLTNEYLEKMSFMMKIDFDDNFNETIYARFRDKLSYSQLSQGEQSRVNTAILMSWRKIAELRNSARVSILILDEILDATLASADVEVMMQMIRGENEDQKFFLVSHKPEIVAPFCDNIINIEKRGNFSQILDGE